jgi:hypothetical protein
MCIQYGDQIKDHEIGGTCSTHGDHEICKQQFSSKKIKVVCLLGRANTIWQYHFNNNMPTATVFLDIDKASDTTWYLGLLRK